MHNGYDDYQTGTFIPDIVIAKREDNGHFTASSMGYSYTHHSQDEAVSQLTTKLQKEIAAGVIHPGM